LNQRVPSDYRFSRALVLRSFGLVLAALGVLLFMLAVLVAVLDLSLGVLTAGLLLTVLGVVAAAFLASRLRTVVVFDETGYEVRWLRGAGVKQSRWREVEDAVTASVAGHDCVVLRLRDGRTTTIPVDVLDADPEGLLRDLASHLDKGHGYRRLA
jgi:hypothetical protein